MQQNKSFTLIELLVVISVIGLLSSVVLVSFKGTNEKARISKALEFSQSINHALGAEAAGIWTFDEGSGQPKDSSGNGNNGVRVGTNFTDDTPYKIVGSGGGKYALSFDGNSFVGINNFDKVAPKDEVTISVWTKTNTLAGQHDLFWMGTAQNYRITVHFPWNNQLVWQYGECCKGATIDSVSSVGIAAGRWYHLALVSSKSLNAAIIYLNGKEVKKSDQSGSFVPSTTASAWFVGGRTTEGHGFNGFIDELMVFGQALSIGQIQRIYTEGLEKHQDLAIK